MPDQIRKVEYYYATVPDKPGEGARILGALKEAGVNLMAFHAFPVGAQSQVDLVAEDAGALKEAAKKAGISLTGPKTAFLVEGEDRIGAVAEFMKRLGDAGVNVVAIDAVRAGGGRYGALFWVKPQDVEKAAGALGVK
ncbi:hypothetical protein HRbin33_01145 [bacterium HR33]|nr:hypothetical protein HRbin33_01145 [bacterium HR33]